MVGKSKSCTGHRFGKQLQLVILLAGLILAPPLSAQQVQSWEVTPGRLVLGDLDRVKAVCVTGLEWSPSLTVTIPAETGGFYYLADPQIEAVTEGPFRGKAKVTLTIRVLERGILVLQPIGIKRGAGEPLVSLPPLVLPVLRYDEKDFPYPLDVQWASGMPEQCFVGQPVYLVLLLKNTKEILVPDDIRLEAPQSGVLEKESLNPPIETVTYGSLKLYSVPIAVWVYTPTIPGRTNIPGAVVTIGGIKRTAPPVSLNVVPLPEGVEATGAVGQFVVELTADRDQLYSSEFLTVTVTVQGSGNLNYLKSPEPAIHPADGLELVSVREETRIKPVLTGYTGTRTFHYRYQSRLGGAYRLSLPGFFYLDPVRGNVLKSEPSPLDILVNEREEGMNTVDTGIKHPIGISDLPYYLLKLDHRNPYLYFLFLPGPLLLACFYLRRWGLRQQAIKVLYGILLFICATVVLTSIGVHFIMADFPGEDEMVKGNLSFEEKALDEALFYYGEALLLAPDNPALLYNLGLAYYEKGDPAAAIFHLRKALTFRPRDRRMLHLIKEIEEQTVPDRDSIPLLGMIPEALFFGVILLANLVFLLLYRYLRSGQIRMALAGLFCFLVLLAFAAVYTRWNIQMNRPFAVIRNIDSDMKKAPSDSASPWLGMNRGTTVRIIAETDEFLLVRTVYSVEGWIRKEDVWF